MIKSNNIAKNVLIILGISIFSKLAAFIAEAVIASYLGTSYKADAYSMISGIQQVIYPLLSVGIWNVFLPDYKKQLVENGEIAADSLANKMISVFLLPSFLVSVIIIICPSIIVSIIAPGYKDEVKELTAKLIRITSPQYIFVVGAAFYSSMLQVHNKFFASQIREIASYIPVIVSALFFYKMFGIHVLAIGVLLGSFLRLMIQIPFINWGYKFRVNINFKDINVINMLKRMPSALITAAVTQLNTLIDKVMASTLQVGAVSSISYGNRLINVFSGLITSAMSTALYPNMAQLIAEKAYESLKSLLVRTIYFISAIIIPVSIFCIIFSKEIVIIIFQRGAFDSNSVYNTARVFTSYTIGMLFFGLKDVLSNVYYSYGDTKVTMKTSVITIIINIILNFILMNTLGAAGLALATSISAAFGIFFLIINLKKYIRLNYADILKELSKTILSSALSTLISMFILNFIKTNYIIIDMILFFSFSAPIYLFGLKITRSKVIELVVSFFKKNKTLV